MDHVKQAPTWSPNKSVSQASAELQISQTNNRILQKNLCLTPYKSQELQKLTA
jgi:hypothetical protein